MNMQQVTGLSLILLFAARPGGAWAMEDVPHGDVQGSAQYKRADAKFYGKGDVLRAHPSAMILPQGGYTQTGDTYFFPPKAKTPKTVWAETVSDWIEPITPPDMPASLGVPPDAMQIREPQGDVQVALPSAPTSFAPVTAGMTLPNGAVLKTGADGTAAVLFGGVDSARLMPNSEAAVQQTVTAQARSAEVDLTAGGVFSKVGTQVGVKGEYAVHTPSGNASSSGGDFATVIASSRVDVWVAQGAVQLDGTDGQKGPVVTSDGTGPLKIVRLPGITDPHLSFLADTETLTAVLNFIPLADQKIKALRAKLTGGATLTTNEQAYLARIKKVPCVIKLALLEAPAPKPIVSAPVLAPLPPVAPATPPAVTAPVATAPAANPPPASDVKPITLRVRIDGKVNYQKVTLTVNELKTRLAAIAKTTPNQEFIVRAGKTVAYPQIQAVLGVFHDAGLQNVTVVAPPASSPSTATTTPGQPAENLPTPGLLMHPSMEPITNNTAPTSTTPTTNSPASATP